MLKEDITRFAKAESYLKIKDPFVWNERFLSIGGVWPQQRADILFMITVLNCSLIMVLQYWDLCESLRDLDLAVMNVLETFATTSMYFGSLLVAISRKQLGRVIDAMKREIADERTFADNEERRLYFNYNIMARRICKSVAVFTFFTVFMMYLRPAIRLALLSRAENSTIPYQLPFRIHIMFDYRKPRIYALLYVYLFSTLYIPTYHVGAVGLLVNVMLHLCAKLSILTYRVRNIRLKPAKQFNDDVKRVVIMQLELTKLSDTLNNCYHLILLLELTNRGFRLGLALYIVLLKLSTEPMVAMIFFLHAVVMSGYLFLYSYIGEQVQCESQNVGEAFYNIGWPEVTNSARKTLLICITNGQKSLNITAGKMFTFSLFGFTGIMKTSMASFSVLQARM